MLVGLDVRRSLKEHVLEQVGEPGPPGAFIGRPDVIPQIDGDDRRGVVFRDRDEQPVRKPKRFDGICKGPGMEVGGVGTATTGVVFRWTNSGPRSER